MAYRLPQEEWVRREHECIRLAKARVTRREISSRLKMNGAQVARVLRDAGVPVFRKTYKPTKHVAKANPIWETENEELLKRRFTAKAAAGARAQLKAISAVS